MKRIGVVVIGRNEGAHLKQCLESVLRQSDTLVYVDSGSSDGSIPCARALGVAVVALDARTRLTVARARNAGFEYLLSRYDELDFIQYLDGDCELVEGW